MRWILKEKNYIVTEYYFDILKQAGELVCNKVILIDRIHKKSCDKHVDLFIVGSIVKARILFFQGYKNIIVWFQGIIPEESYMRNNSSIRKKTLEMIEKKVLEKTKLAILVSKTMKKHYEDKYKIDFTDRYYIMPCFNTNIKNESFFKDRKYKNNIFSYIGGLSPWQGIDKIFSCYKKIEELGLPNTKILVLTSEKDKALIQIKKAGIVNFEINYVKVAELPSILADVKFGFVIRDSNLVNQVATPTKLSTYLANGIIPIYSENIKDFHDQVKEYKYVLSFDSNVFIEEVTNMMMSEINAQYINNEYAKLFKSYYNVNKHRDAIAIMLKNILEKEISSKHHIRF